ncbi:MAG: hypothetical protein JWM40_276 [Frankiales bacterium]|nr:hypothetical protein [Frankiales bacterium]
MAPRYRGKPVTAFTFAGGAITLSVVVASPGRMTLGLTGLGLVLGVVAGWLSGLLRAPRS